MLESFLSKLAVDPGDVQIWECNPLLILDANGVVVFAQATKLEFTPILEDPSIVGHAVSSDAGALAALPEIAVATRQYIDNPIEMSRRQGIILQGADQSGSQVTWLINGAADRFLTTPDAEQLDYDEETAKLLQDELEGEPEKLNLNSFI